MKDRSGMASTDILIGSCTNSKTRHSCRCHYHYVGPFPLKSSNEFFNTCFIVCRAGPQSQTVLSVSWNLWSMSLLLPCPVREPFSRHNSFRRSCIPGIASAGLLMRSWLGILLSIHQRFHSFSCLYISDAERD